LATARNRGHPLSQRPGHRFRPPSLSRDHQRDHQPGQRRALAGAMRSASSRPTHPPALSGRALAQADQRAARAPSPARLVTGRIAPTARPPYRAAQVVAVTVPASAVAIGPIGPVVATGPIGQARAAATARTSLILQDAQLDRSAPTGGTSGRTTTTSSPTSPTTGTRITGRRLIIFRSIVTTSGTTFTGAIHSAAGIASGEHRATRAGAAALGATAATAATRSGTVLAPSATTTTFSMPTGGAPARGTAARSSTEATRRGGLGAR
jgi:hypothetical protein